MRKVPAVVLQMTSASTGVWEGGLLIYHKSVRTVRTNQNLQKSPLAGPQASPFFVDADQIVNQKARDHCSANIVSPIGNNPKTPQIQDLLLRCN